MKINDLVADFLKYLKGEKNRSKLTSNNYEFYLNRFSQWTDNPSPEKIDLEMIKKYRSWLDRLKFQQNKRLKKNTKNYHLIALRSFLEYLNKKNIKSLSPEKIKLAKTPGRLIELLEGKDLENLLEAPLKIAQPEIIKFRDKAILELLFSTGLSVSELANLTKEKINLKNDEFMIRGKNGKLRTVFLSHQAKFWLKKYLDSRQDIEPALFISYDRAAGNRLFTQKSNQSISLTPRSTQRIIKKYAKTAGINKKITPSTLRHSFAANLLANGADIRSIQVILGHSSLSTTKIYSHITDKKLEETYKFLHH